MEEDRCKEGQEGCQKGPTWLGYVWQRTWEIWQGISWVLFVIPCPPERKDFHKTFCQDAVNALANLQNSFSLFADWFLADKSGWCWFVVRGKHCWLADKHWLKPSSVKRLIVWTSKDKMFCAMKVESMLLRWMPPSESVGSDHSDYEYEYGWQWPCLYISSWCVRTWYGNCVQRP